MRRRTCVRRLASLCAPLRRRRREGGRSQACCATERGGARTGGDHVGRVAERRETLDRDGGARTADREGHGDVMSAQLMRQRNRIGLGVPCHVLRASTDTTNPTSQTPWPTRASNFHPHIRVLHIRHPIFILNMQYGELLYMMNQRKRTTKCT